MPNPEGRPTKYKPEYCEQAAKLCALGAIDLDLAAFFNVEESTIYEWKNAHPKFSESIKEAKDNEDAKVVKSLYKRAMGFTRNVQKLSQQGDVLDTKEELPPDTTACIFWLKNRQKKDWRDRQELEHSGNVKLIGRIKEK